jgi:hypothetical protein
VIPCLDDPIGDTIPLSAREKTLIAELEAVVERGLEHFLAVGDALAKIRNQRHYLTHYATFEAYVRDRFGLARSTVDQLIRSSQTAQTLLDSGINLPSATPEAVIRPLSGLPGEDLQAACWNLVVSVAPERGPSQPLVSHLCRTIRDILDGPGGRHTSDRQAHTAIIVAGWMRRRGKRLSSVRSKDSRRGTVSRLK